MTSKYMPLIQEKTRQFKSDLKRYFPSKRIAEYTRLMDALEDFEQYALMVEDEPEEVNS